MGSDIETVQARMPLFTPKGNIFANVHKEKVNIGTNQFFGVAKIQKGKSITEIKRAGHLRVSADGQPKHLRAA